MKSNSQEAKKTTKQRSNKGTKEAENMELKFLYTNADQFVNKRDDLLARIAGDEPDVILITEVIPKSQANPIPSALLSIDGYKPSFNFDPSSTNLGASGIRGVAIYSKTTLNAYEIDINVKDSADHIWIELPTSSQPLLVGCIYRSPSNDGDKDAAMKSATITAQVVKAAFEKNNNVVMAGDFNYKEIDWDNEHAPTNKEHQANFINALQECYMYQHVTEPTRFRSNETPNLLDLILSSEESMIKDLVYRPPLGESDHICLRFNVMCGKQEFATEDPKKRNFFKTDYAAVAEELRKYDWVSMLTGNFDDDYKLFFDILEQVMMKYTPLKTPRRKKKNLYMTRESRIMKNKKLRLWRKFLLTRSTYDHNNYIRCKNSFRALSRKLRRDFELEITKDMKEKPKHFWNYATSRLKTREKISSLAKPDGTTAKTAQDKAETLNNFFASVFTVEDLTNMPSPPTYVIDEVIYSILITPEVVQNKLKSLNPNKSPGHDNWHPHFLCQIADVICLPLSILYGKSLKEGSHATWRKAIIAAIYKKGKKSDPGNYRPVSLTSVISKIMESIVRDAVVEHLMKNNLFTNDQHGFVPGRNCITQLLVCLEEWTQMIEDGVCFDAIYTDFAKAFDSVPHERLFLKIESLGIKGDILSWLKSFLQGRTQCVNVDGACSSWQKVVSGIPQGSVIGPILFVIFINDMPDVIKHNFCKLFADDCKLYGEVTADGENLVQTDLTLLEEWSRIWQLPFNAKKCKSMHFGRKNPKRVYTLNGQELEQITSEKDLGVMVDDELKFHVHAAAATKKANQMLGVIKRTYRTRDAETMMTLYKSMVRPHLEYGNAIWGPIYMGDLKLIEGVQRRATKLIPHLKELPYEERLTALNLPSMEYRRKRGDMIQCFKIMNSLVRLEKEVLFTPIPSDNTRGHNQRVLRHKTHNATRAKSFSQRSIRNWNSLPKPVINAPSVDTFKNRLDEAWKDRAFKTSAA